MGDDAADGAPLPHRVPHPGDGLAPGLLGELVLAEDRLAARVPAGLAHLSDLLQVAERADPAADHRDPLPGELVSGDVLGGVQLPPAELRRAGDCGHEGTGPGAGRIHHRTGAQHGQSPSVGPDRADQEGPLPLPRTRRIVLDTGDAHGPTDLEPGPRLELGEVVGHRDVRGDVAADLRGRGVGQLADPVDGGHGEAVPAVAPGPAGPLLRVEDHEAQPAAAQQVVGGGQSRLSGADHHHVQGLHARCNGTGLRGVPPRDASHARGSACTMSAQRSSMSSRPTLRRTVPGPTPHACRCCALRWE